MTDDEEIFGVWSLQENDYDDGTVLAADYLFAHKKRFEMNHSAMTYVLLEQCPTIAKLTAKVHIELTECVCR